MDIKTFTISKNCPAKYVGENRYLTTWEKRMKKAIDKQIDEEIEEKREREKPVVNGTRRLVIVMDRDLLDVEGFRKKRTNEIEKVYRTTRTLKILKKCGLDTEEFSKTWMGSCSRYDMLLGCIQDKIDGFDYDSEGARIPNNKKMNVNNMTVEYQEGILRISDGNNTNEFMVDAHQLIFVNGEEVFKLSKIPTADEEREMLQELFDDMHSDRLRHERAMEKSLEAAKNFWVK